MMVIYGYHQKNINNKPFLRKKILKLVNLNIIIEEEPIYKKRRKTYKLNYNSQDTKLLLQNFKHYWVLPHLYVMTIGDIFIHSRQMNVIYFFFFIIMYYILYKYIILMSPHFDMKII